MSVNRRTNNALVQTFVIKLNDMNMQLIIVASCMLLMMGCKRTPLQRTTSEIKQGMNQEQVNILFKDFSASEVIAFSGKLKNSVDNPKSIRIAFQTNSFIGESVRFYPSHSDSFISPFEECTVFFDTNKIVMGYHFAIDY